MDIEQIKREVFHAVYDTQITQPSGIFEAIDYLHSRGYLGGVPEGYCVVPKEPTDKIISAAEDCGDDEYGGTAEEGDIYMGTNYNMAEVYKAMIAAAPKGETKCY